MVNPSASSGPSLAGTVSTTLASIMITSAGDPAASLTSAPTARFAAVRLSALVATTRPVPSHHAETAIRWGFPDVSAVASHRSRCPSSAPSTSVFRASTVRKSAIPALLQLSDRVHVIAPSLAARSEVLRALQALAYQCDLPTVFATQAVDEGRRGAHHADAFDPFLQQPRGQRLHGLACRCRGFRVVGISPREHHEVGERREGERFARRQLGGVEAFVVVGGRAGAGHGAVEG